MESTTREQITSRLREEAQPATALAAAFGVSVGTTISHLEHISQSLQNTDDQLLVAAPECRECGFDGFDDLLNVPGRCPRCHRENIEPPVFRIAGSGR